MNTCQDHDCIIVHDRRKCPVCEEFDNYKLALEHANDKIQELEHEIERQTQEIEDLLAKE